jgi:membrane glycosyltransferase
MPCPECAEKTRADGVIRLPAMRLRRWVFFVLVLASTGFGVNLMLDILSAGGMTLLESSILVLFAVTFAWIAISFWTAVAGFILQLASRDPLTLGRSFRRGDPTAPLTSRTAVVMPVYNEDVARVIAGLESTWRDLQATGQGAAFDFYLLSDSSDPTIAAAEETAWRALQQQLVGGSRLYYRRRRRNEGRKAGNIAEFCHRWGAYYECMVTLDADSIMTGDAIVRMAAAMEANPSAGMIQTVPIPVRQETMFGRFVQFGANLYSPMLATGLSFWQGDAANYWGHNAIIRVQAFTEHCGLPELPGRPPLGGEILSHDFVEAALIRRGGWAVYLLPELKGSFEEMPANVLDFAKRDRRWTEGNLQHVRLLNAHGLHPLNRLHFLLGAFAYACSFFWLLMLGLGTVDALGRALTVHEFFHSGYQLFPDWPVAKVEEILLLLGVVIGMLVLPKVFGVLLCLVRAPRRRAFGGAIRVIASAIFELFFSVLLAPVMMSFHAWFVATILSGHNITWGPQARNGRRLSWREVLRNTWILTACGLAWGLATWWLSPIFFWALTPVLVGLILAGPLVAWSSRDWIGGLLRRCGIFLTPQETGAPPVLDDVELLLNRSRPTVALDKPGTQLMLLPDFPRPMPAQRLDSGPRWNHAVAGLAIANVRAASAATGRADRG